MNDKFDVKLPDEYFLIRLPSYFGAQQLKFPSFTNHHGIEFWYNVPLKLVSDMAKKNFYKEIQGSDAVPNGKDHFICQRCKQPVYESDKYCSQCGYLLNWKEPKSIYKRTTKQTRDNPYWKNLAEEEAGRNLEKDAEKALEKVKPKYEARYKREQSKKSRVEKDTEGAESV